MAATWLAVVLTFAAPPSMAAVEAPSADEASEHVAISAPSKEGAWTVRVLARTAVHRRPGGPLIGRLRPQTPWSGASLQLMVLRAASHRGRQWLLVRLPDRPNNAAGWILRDRVWLMRNPYYIEISRSRRSLRLYREGRRLATYKAVVGRPQTPTPLGLFAILESVPQPNPRGFLGPWAIHLTAHSEVLRRFDGGPGRIAIHGRAGESLLDPLGSARSNGCIRINNGPIKQLARLAPGTPVRILG